MEKQQAEEDADAPKEAADLGCGSPHTDISIYNLFPEEELEALLHLIERLNDRISTIDELGLLDGSVLGEVVHPRTAVKKARRILARYDGVLIADSVGLGKTWIGKKLLEDFAYHRRQKAVVVCPASEER